MNNPILRLNLTFFIHKMVQQCNVPSEKNSFYYNQFQFKECFLIILYPLLL